GVELASRGVPARVDNAGLCASNVLQLRTWLDAVLERAAPDVVALVVTPWSLRRDAPPAPARDRARAALATGLDHLARWSAVMERGVWYDSHLASRLIGWPAGSVVAWELVPLLEPEDAFTHRWHDVTGELD